MDSGLNGFTEGARIAVSNPTVVVSWTSGGEMLVARASDAGAGWTDVQRLVPLGGYRIAILTTGAGPSRQRHSTPPVLRGPALPVSA